VFTASTPGNEGREAVREGKFIDLRRFKEGAWKITRVLGYGHPAGQVASAVGSRFAAAAIAVECII
jgi:hypothetical protein